MRIEIAQGQWLRRDRYSFVRGSEEKRTTEVEGERGRLRIASGIENLVALRTAGSSFEGYKKDKYTTLKETSDRIMASAIRAHWKYERAGIAYTPCWEKAREAMLNVFSERDSASVQPHGLRDGRGGARGGAGDRFDPADPAQQALPAG